MDLAAQFDLALDVDDHPLVPAVDEDRPVANDDRTGARLQTCDRGRREVEHHAVGAIENLRLAALRMLRIVGEDASACRKDIPA